MSTTTSSQPDPDHSSTQMDSIPSTSDCDCSQTAGDRTSSTPPDPNGPSVSPPNPDKPPRRKQPMKDFEWGGNLVRKTLPIGTIPRWLDPAYVDVADPTKLPLCWYGVPFEENLVYAYTERKGLARYYTKQALYAEPGELDTFQSWANFDMWLKKVSGLQVDLNLVWGQPTPILTFFSNHELLRVTKDQLELILDLLEDMDYGEEYQLMWYLDRRLAY